MAPEKIKEPIVFVLGAPRSGTTLLRVMLAGHPQLFSPPEMVMAIHETMEERKQYLEARYWEKGGLQRALMELLEMSVEQSREMADGLVSLSVPETYAWFNRVLNGRILVDKCPHLAFNIAWMERLEEWFENARYLWIMRHPGSVIRSLQNMPMAEVMLAGFGGSAEEAWIMMNRNIQTFLSKIPRERWSTVVYEDLVTDPRPVMERACKVMGVPFHEAVLNPYEGERMTEGPKGARAIGDPNLSGRGKLDPSLATHWLEGYDPAAASEGIKSLARELGYDLASAKRPPITKVTDGLNALLDTVRELERSIQLPMDLDALEGRRFLMRMLGASWDMMVEAGDPDRPRFEHAETPIRKMFGDNPDADYMRAPLKMGPGRVYRVSGKIHPNTAYFAVLLYGKGGRVARQLRDTEIPIGPAAGLPDGQFEVFISTEPQEGCWLQAEPDIESTIVRQYFNDRRKELPIELEIAYLGEASPGKALEPLPLASQIDRASRMLRSTWKRTLGAYQLASQAFFNHFGVVPAEGLFPTPDNLYQMCWWRIGYNQVMRVKGKLPKARYFSLCLYNAWMESYDYLKHPIILNQTQLQTDDQGMFEVVLSHRDLGQLNRLDTAGHHAGYLVARYLCLDGEPEELSVTIQYENEYLAQKS
ncbi:MAG: sulfotransferase family protein [Myxococcota bacterium]